MIRVHVESDLAVAHITDADDGWSGSRVVVTLCAKRVLARVELFTPRPLCPTCKQMVGILARG